MVNFHRLPLVAALAAFVFETDAFAPHRTKTRTLRTTSTPGVRRYVSVSSTFDDDSEERASKLRETVESLGSSYLESISDAILWDDAENDEYEARLEHKKALMRQRSLPKGKLVTLSFKTDAPKVGLLLAQVTPALSDDQTRIDGHSLLNFDTLEYESGPSSIQFDPTQLPNDLKGVVAAAVEQDGQAWKAGVRPGDLLMASSATIGDAMWPKATLEGVRSAVTSRKVVSSTLNLQFQLSTLDNMVDNRYELSLSKPIGLEIEEDSKGYVVVTGFNENASKLARNAVQLGDRIVAVASSLGGSLWPVSSVDGVISACTARLPGQKVTMQFERPKENLAAISAAAISTKSEQETKASQTLEAHESLTADQQNQLLKRCRLVLRRYLSEEKDETTFVRKYSVPVMVADKVVDAVASASVSLDAPTLCMIMNAYVSCQKADRAIRLFEAAIGVSSDGSNDPVDVVISGAERGKLVRDAAALNLYTASSLLQALAATDDISSTKRVLAALQGKGGTVIDGKETAAWPGTGGNGSIVLDTTAYNIALASAAKNQRNVDSMLEIFNDMGDIKIASGGQPPKDVISYNTVIGGLSNAGKAADALDTFARMRKTGIKPDKYTFTSLVKACSHPNDMQELLYEMKDNGIKPDIVTYNTMIRTLCDRLQWYEAKNLINEMENSGIKPNSMTYGFLMTGLFKAKKFSACLSLFESACTDGRTAPLTENVHLYTTAISAAASLNNYEKAFNLVNRMKQAGVIPNLKTLTALLSACLSSEKTDLAVEVFKQISKPDNVAMSKGIEAMCYEGHFEEVMSTLYQQWRMRGSVMSGKEIVVGYDRLLRESLRQGRLETAKRAMTDFLRMGFIPSNQMLETIVDSLGLSPPQKNSAYAKKVPEEHFDYVLFVLDSLRARNLACDGNFYASILFCASRLGGLRRKIGSLMATARQSTMTNTNTLISETKGSEEIHSHRVGWMYLLHHYDECKEGGEVKLPSLRVNVAKSQVRRVLAADQSVSYGKKS